MVALQAITLNYMYHTYLCKYNFLNFDKELE